MPMDHERSLEELKEALQAEQRGGVQLLSIPQLCQELGMGKSWIYRRLRSGEIPSVRLGRTIKVRRDELEQYLQRHHYPIHVQEALQEEDSPPQ
jgi:excisionase family DNA binding protein